MFHRIGSSGLKRLEKDGTSHSAEIPKIQKGHCLQSMMDRSNNSHIQNKTGEYTMKTPFYKQLESINACSEAVAWAKGKSAQKAWDTCTRGDWMIWLLTQNSVNADQSKLRLLACDCAESVLHLVPAGEDRPRQAIEVARRFARGEATRDELAAARVASSAASSDAARDAARDASSSAAWAASWDASSYASLDASRAASWAASWAAAWAASRATSWVASRVASRATSWDAASYAENKKQADFCRKWFPICPEIPNAKR